MLENKENIYINILSVIIELIVIFFKLKVNLDSSDSHFIFI